jgi:hypothetical protein
MILLLSLSAGADEFNCSTSSHFNASFHNTASRSPVGISISQEFTHFEYRVLDDGGFKFRVSERLRQDGFWGLFGETINEHDSIWTLKKNGEVEQQLGSKEIGEDKLSYKETKSEKGECDPFQVVTQAQFKLTLLKEYFAKSDSMASYDGNVLEAFNCVQEKLDSYYDVHHIEWFQKRVRKSGSALPGVVFNLNFNLMFLVGKFQMRDQNEND